jgi:hypothetical protein
MADAGPATCRGRVGDVGLADDLVQDQVQEAALAADVPVEGGGAGA